MKHDKLKNAFDLSRFDFKKLQEFDDQIPLMKAKLAQDAIKILENFYTSKCVN